MRFTLSVFLFALPLAAWAQAPLTEAEAARRGLARADLADLEGAALLAADAEVRAAGLYPNPTLRYGRERLDGSPGAVEQSWMLEQAFDLSGRRGLHREAAERRASAVSADNAHRRQQLSAQIRRSFHSALRLQAAIRATETWVERFTRVARMVDTLTGAGEASGYDQRRLSRERQAAEARLATERAELERESVRLAALIGVEGAPLQGELLPSPLPTVDAALKDLERHPELQALARRAEAADFDRHAAGRGAIPELTVGVGSKQVESGGVKDTGLALSLSVPLPVFDRQQAGRQRALAEAQQARAEYRIAKARAEGALRGLHRQAEALRAAAADYRNQALAASPELLRIAEAAYRGGESSLLELLDAYRGALETETTALDLEWRAREARIDYDLLTGNADQ